MPHSDNIDLIAAAEELGKAVRGAIRKLEAEELLAKGPNGEQNTLSGRLTVTGTKLKKPASQTADMTPEALKKAAAAAADKLDGQLWLTIRMYAQYPFHTAKGLEFRYTIRGNEMFVDRKNKSITRATVNLSFRRLLELGGVASGPKKLGTFGASYIYAIFMELGILKTGREKAEKAGEKRSPADLTDV